MGRLFFAALIALPLLEIAGFVIVGKAVGVLGTLGLVLLSGLVGILVLRAKGMMLPFQLRAAVERGELPGRSIADAMLVALAGVLLIVPGFVTDIVALLLLLPPVRGLIYRALSRSLKVVTTYDVSTSAHPTYRSSDTIELESDQWRDR